MYRSIFALLACAASLAALPAPPSFLLPDGVKPTKYTIELTIDPSLDTFSGVARIELDLSKATNIVWVNAKGLIPSEASIDWKGKSTKAHAEASGEEFIGVETDALIGPGRATVTI